MHRWRCRLVCGRSGVSDERSLTTQSGAKPRCAAHTLSGRKANSAPRDYSAAGVSTQLTRHSVRRRRAREGPHGGSRPAAAVSVAAAISDCAGMQQLATAGAPLQRIALRCNRQCCDPTGRAIVDPYNFVGNSLRGRECVCGRAPTGRRPILVGNSLTKRECTGVGSAQAGANAP